MEALKIEELSFSYDGERKGQRKEVLSRVSLTAGTEEAIGLIGANGAGKSTLLKLLVGLVSGYSGSLLVNGLSLTKKNLDEIRKSVGYVFQDSDSQLFLNTVYEDVAFGPQNYGYPPQEVEERALAALRSVRMEALKDRQIYRLSGGEKKLAAIATILSMKPRILLLDEPSVGLDPRNRRNLIAILREMKGLKIIASHDLDMVWDICERTVLVYQGRVVADEPTGKILQNRELLEANGLELPLSLAGRQA